MERTGIIAILRGIPNERVEEIVNVLHEAGIRRIEVPLNSPNPFTSIERAREFLPGDCEVGAGTVVRAQDVGRVRDSGGQFVVSPNLNVEVVRATVAENMASYPGVATPSEAYAALEAGATALKLFPACQLGLAAMKAWRPVLPEGTRLIPVGGVTADDFEAWVRAGADGFGMGTALYSPKYDVDEVRRRSERIVASWQKAIDQEDMK